MELVSLPPPPLLLALPQQQFVFSSYNSGAFSAGVDIIDLPFLLQMTDFQIKLAAFSMGGLAMYMPPIIVNPFQLFKTSDSSEFLELGVMLQVLPRVSGNAAQPVNQNAVVRVFTNAHRELMLHRKEEGLYKQVNLLSNSVSSSSLVSRRRMELFSSTLCYFKSVMLIRK